MYPGQTSNVRNTNLGTNPQSYQTVYNIAPFPTAPAAKRNIPESLLTDL